MGREAPRNGAIHQELIMTSSLWVELLGAVSQMGLATRDRME